MMRQLWLGALVALLSARVTAQSPFDGTWKIDTSDAQPSTAHFDYLLKDGTYRCISCDPPIVIPADGRDHKITGEPCYDTVNIKVVNDRTIDEADKRNGATVGTTRITVSSGGNEAMVDWTESCSANGDVVSGKDIMSRLERGPAGSHAISGSWKISKRVERSENALVITLKLTEDTFSFADPTDQKFTAKLDGAETRFQGDLSGTMVSVKRVDQNTIEEANKRDGRVVEIVRFTVSPDGKSLHISVEDKSKGTTKQFVAHRQ
jgi:hypothetical protein